MSIEILQAFERCLPVRQRIHPDRQRGAKKTVLVAEADVELCEVIVSILRCAGYEILAVPSLLEAISICKRSSVTIDLILSDFNFPGGNGAELTTRLSVLRPGLPVIFMSGNQTACLNLRAKGCVVLEMPFSLAELTGVVREILGAPTDPTTFQKPVERSSMQ